MVFEQLYLARAEAPTGNDQVGSSRERLGECRSLAPGSDGLMVASEQHLWDAPTAKFGRTCVLGILEEAKAEALLDDGLLVAENPRDETGDRLNDHQGSELTASEHNVADGELIINQMVNDALVDPLVSTAQQSECAGIAGKFGRERPLIERPPTRTPGR